MRTTCSLASLASLASFIALLAPARDARADPAPPPTWTLEAGAQLRWWSDGSAEALAPEALSGSQLMIGRRLARFEAGRPLDLGVFVRLGGGTADGELFQSLATRVSQTTLTAGVRLDAPLWRRLRVVGLVELGAAHTSAVIGADLGAMAPVDDAAWAGIGASTLGLELVAVQGRRFHLAMRVEAGVVIAQRVGITAYPRERPVEELSIPTLYAELGELDTSGRTLGFSVRGGF